MKSAGRSAGDGWFRCGFCFLAKAVPLAVVQICRVYVYSLHQCATEKYLSTDECVVSRIRRKGARVEFMVARARVLL